MKQVYDKQTSMTKFDQGDMVLSRLPGLDSKLKEA